MAKPEKEPKHKPKYRLFACVGYMYRYLWKNDGVWFILEGTHKFVSVLHPQTCKPYMALHNKAAQKWRKF